MLGSSALGAVGTASAGPASDGLAPPVGYSSWWVVLGVTLLMLVVGWYAWVLWRTRRRGAAKPERVAPRDLDAVRRRYLEQIDEVAGRARAGVLTPRAAHQRLSEIVRAYATETGHPVSASTLADLIARGPAPVADVVRGYYPAEFAAHVEDDPQLAAATAHRLVSTWS